MNRDITKTEAAQSTDSAWKNLYRIGGTAALIVGILTPIDVLFFVIWPQPTTIQGWFALFQKNWVIGLLDLDLLGMIIYVIAVPSILALYFSLRRASQSWIAISTALTFIGIAAYFGSNTIFSMLSLSNQYATASSDAQKSLFLIENHGSKKVRVGLAPAQTDRQFGLAAASLLDHVMCEIFLKKCRRK